MLENIFDVLTRSDYGQNVPRCWMVVLLISSMESLIYLNLNLLLKVPLISIPDYSDWKLTYCPPSHTPPCLFCDLATVLLMCSTHRTIFRPTNTYGACLIVLLWHLFKNVTFLMKNHHHLIFMITKWKSLSYTHGWAWTKGHHSTPKIMSTGLLRLLPL